jgi:hypothetical protein
VEDQLKSSGSIGSDERGWNQRYFPVLSVFFFFFSSFVPPDSADVSCYCSICPSVHYASLELLLLMVVPGLRRQRKTVISDEQHEDEHHLIPVTRMMDDDRVVISDYDEDDYPD